jgi:hypothetical protein
VRDQFFSGSVRAGDQHARIGRRDLVDDVLDVVDRIAVADHFVVLADFFLQYLILDHELFFVERVSDRVQKPVQIGRF